MGLLLVLVLVVLLVLVLVLVLRVSSTDAPAPAPLAAGAIPMSALASTKSYYAAVSRYTPACLFPHLHAIPVIIFSARILERESED